MSHNSPRLCLRTTIYIADTKTQFSLESLKGKLADNLNDNIEKGHQNVNFYNSNAVKVDQPPCFAAEFRELF